MKKQKIVALFAVVVLAVASISGCSTSSKSEGEGAQNRSFEGQELRVSTFSFNAELLQKNVYDPFMELTGAKLIVEGGKNAERVTKIKEAPQNYDVVVISDSFASDLIASDVIEEINRSNLTNLDSLHEIAKAPLGEEYAPAYTFNRLGIVFDGTTTPADITSWEDLWQEEFEGSIVIPDITATTGPIFYYSIADMMGLTPGVDDEAIFAKLESLKPNIVKTYTSANDAINMLNQGEAVAAVLLDYSYTEAKKANEDYLWVDPLEGAYSGFNTINIIKDTPNRDLAEAFIDFYLSKEVQLAEALDGVDSPVNKEVELTEDQAANFAYGETIMSTLRLPNWSVINENKAAWINRWNELFSVK